ncbi:GGDEF domain-containing protein [Caballeronia sp. LZ034LL]|uniref:GGDEF domain-containing protein n=1 Tax=Caballeronia sp. LZ034LL TaxID=3038567 RepID=UPI00285574A1|nr:GGDEF domain-containing protein [Caballeronia sp. LZ034LL]MDR5837280.1 GGDEF domain-containing protein [Caballeronia sp. LZ034LL]
MTSNSSGDATPAHAPDLFENETAALEKARGVHAADGADAEALHQSLGALIDHFERLMRETRRLIGRSDRAEREMQVLAQQLAHRASHDALTGVLNRSAVIEQATRTLKERSATMIVLDIDEFKRVNDDFGHPTGDAVILGVVDCLRRIVGERGFIGRVGGEEFTVLVPGDDHAAAALLAERMRAAISEARVVPSLDRRITVSFGVSHNRAGTGFDTAYGLADEALYRAKRGGRNRVEFAAQS